MNNTEAAICRAMLSLMEEQPLRTIKVTKLAERAGISRSTFYLYFTCIEDVVQRIEDQIFEGTPEPGTVAPYVAVDERQWRHYYSQMSKQLHAYGLLTGPNGDPAFVARLEDRDRKSLEASATPQFKAHQAVELEIIHEFIHGGKMRAARWWAAHEDEVSVNDFSSIMLQLLQACARIARR